MPDPEGVDLANVRYPSAFAVAETGHDGVRLLCLVDDQVEATELAGELRRREVRAGAFRMSR